MTQWVLKCRPVVRRAAQGKAAGIAAVVGAGVVAPRPAKPVRQGGQVCHWEMVSTAEAPLYGGALPPGFSGVTEYAWAPAYSGDAGQHALALGGFGSPLDGRDFAALVPAPGVSVMPAGDAMILVPGGAAESSGPVSVPEPSSIALFAVGVVALALVRRARA